MADMRNVTSFHLFHFIVDLLGILLLMINIAKIELINGTNYCLRMSFSVRLFLPIELVLIHYILIWSRSRGLDVVWKNIFYNILSNEWELKVVYQQNFLAGKKLQFFFLPKAFPSSFTVNVW